jgi:predicted GNAT family acetyltransferase
VAGPHIVVRKARETDADAIGDAHAEAWLAGYNEIFDRSFLDAAAEGRSTGWRALITQQGAPNVILVGELDGQVVAFGHAAPSHDEGVAEILGFYCHPRAWGSGVATALMRTLCAGLAVDFDLAMLWTFRDAARARHFYEKVGFRHTGRTRSEALTDWSTGMSVSRPAVEYATPLDHLS